MNEVDRLVEGVCLTINCVYGDGINHDLKFFIDDNHANILINYIAQYLSFEKILSLNINKENIGLVYISSLCDFVHVKEILDNEFSKYNSLILNKKV